MMALTPKKRLFVTAMILLVSGTAQRVAGQDYTLLGSTDQQSRDAPGVVSMVPPIGLSDICANCTSRIL